MTQYYNTFEYNSPAPSKEEADEIAYQSYLKGDICFPTGLTKEEYLKALERALSNNTKGRFHNAI